MPITLDDPRAPGEPVVKRTAIGETFVGAIVAKRQRDVKKDGAVVLKENGKPRQELVVHLVTMPGTTAPAGIGEHTDVPAPGDVVRLILRGGGFGDWIEATKGLGRGIQVGDVVEQTTTHGQVYDAAGNVSGPKLTKQDQIDAAIRARKTVGVYGSLTVRGPEVADAEWVTKAEAAYHARQQATAIALDDGDFI